MDQGIRGVSSGSSRGVVFADWHPGFRQVYLYWDGVGASDPELGARPAVVVEIL